MNTPVLLIIFNRYNIVKKVFEKIHKVRPSKLYIYADAPRNNYKNDKENCTKTREFVLNNIDWQCDVNYRLEEKNLGHALGPHKAISWIFQHEDRAIIIEEDVLPSVSFFEFCEELLERYKDDKRIWAIGGLNHFNGEKNLTKNDSYFFSKYASIWGWATWKDRWELNDFYMRKLDSFVKQGYIFDHVPRPDGLAALKSYKRFYNQLIAGKIDTWDAQWGFTIWSNRGIGIVPAKNLVSNIGTIGVHSKSASELHNMPLCEDFKITKHPDFIQTNHIYDDEYFRRYRKRPNLIKRIFNRIKRIVFSK